MIRRTRVSGLLLIGDKIVLVEHQKKDKKYYLLPGGGINEGETIEEALKREFLEETNLKVKIERLLFLSDTIYPDRSKQIHHLIFSVSLETSAAEKDLKSSDEAVSRIILVEKDFLLNNAFYPPVATEIISFLEGKLSGYGAIYLGKLWR